MRSTCQRYSKITDKIISSVSIGTPAIVCLCQLKSKKKTSDNYTKNTLLLYQTLFLIRLSCGHLRDYCAFLSISRPWFVCGTSTLAVLSKNMWTSMIVCYHTKTIFFVRVGFPSQGLSGKECKKLSGISAEFERTC